MPIVKITPAMPGSVSTAPAIRHEGDEDHKIEHQGHNSIDTAEPVIEHEKNHHHDHAADRGPNALAN